MKNVIVSAVVLLAGCGSGHAHPPFISDTMTSTRHPDAGSKRPPGVTGSAGGASPDSGTDAASTADATAGAGGRKGTGGTADAGSSSAGSGGATCTTDSDCPATWKCGETPDECAVEASPYHRADAGLVPPSCSNQKQDFVCEMPDTTCSPGTLVFYRTKCLAPCTAASDCDTTRGEKCMEYFVNVDKHDKAGLLDNSLAEFGCDGPTNGYCAKPFSDHSCEVK